MSFTAVLPDVRLGRRADRLVQTMVAQEEVSIAHLSQDWAEQMSFYRFLSNPRVRLDDLAEGLYGWIPAWCERVACSGEPAPELLLLQDTTDVSFHRHRGRLDPEDPALGPLSHAGTLGYCLHPTLVLDAQRGWCLGVADVELWARPHQAKPSRSYRDQAIEEKESFRWIGATERAHERLGGPAAPRLTIVADREADIYSCFARRPAGTEAVIRARADRRIAEAPGKLYRALAEAVRLERRMLHLRGDVRKGTQTRAARVEVRARAVTLLRPERSAKPDRHGRRDPSTLDLYAVEVREVGAPKGGRPVRWRLLTTKPVTTAEEAWAVVEIYRQRWYIEQLFRVVKKDGLDVESSELEQGESLQRLGVLCLHAALDVMRLLLGERGESDQPLEQVFAPSEVACLEAVGEKMEGRTQKQQNPHPKHTLAWAGWIIARMGGWKGYASQHRPGPATYHHGLERFRTVYIGWRIARSDVYKP